MEDPSNEDKSVEEVTEFADEGEVLVIRRSLNVIQDNEESWLRDNIFQTRCTSQGKVCNVIIDSGSCTNVVAEEMVTKLNLKTEPHPQPYKIQWFQKDSGLKVSKKCLVSFSIGKSYKDEVWCDVIPMDACHLLLGRPWQYDRKVSHDGFKNTYSFVKDGVRIIIAPLKPESKPSKEVGNFFITDSQVKHALKIKKKFTRTWLWKLQALVNHYFVSC